MKIKEIQTFELILKCICCGKEKRFTEENISSIGYDHEVNQYGHIEYNDGWLLDGINEKEVCWGCRCDYCERSDTLPTPFENEDLSLENFE